MNTPQPSANADAVRFFHEALAADQGGDINLAFQLNLASVSADPNLPGAWNNLGMVLNKLKKYDAAVVAFYRAHMLAPDAVMPFVNYTWSLQLTGRGEEAKKLLLKNILANGLADAKVWASFAQINLTLNLPFEALLAAETAYGKDPESAEVRLVLALSQLRQGHYAEGLKNYEARMEVNPVLRLLLNHPYPIWRGEDVSAKRLYIPCEQGLGDSIMMLPFIQMSAVRAKEVIIHTHTQALKFYQRNLHAPNIKIFPTPRELPAADYYCPTFSLPIALQLSDEEIPKTMRKLKYAPVHFTDLNKREKDEVRIGICWAGDPNHDNDQWRSANLPAFLRLAELPNVRLYSLQVGARRHDLDIYGTHATVRDLSSLIRDANDTAAIIAQHLDIIVCVDTSVAHIAGSMGRRCFVLMGKNSVDWRWKTGEGTSPWYPNTTMVLQKRTGDWVEPIEQVKAIITSAPVCRETE